MEKKYKSKPLKISNGIPVFFEQSDYTRNYDQISNFHLKSENENPFISEEMWLEMENSTFNLLKKFSFKNARILDAGVGTGRILERINEVNKFGVDISLEYLKISKEKGIDVCASMLEDLPYYDEFFDIIISTDVLEHVLDLNAVLFELKRILKRGGIMIIRVPYRENLSPYLDPSYPYEYVHLRNFDEFSIRALMEKIIKIDTIQFEKTAFLSGKRKLNFFKIRILNSIYYRLSAFLIRLISLNKSNRKINFYRMINTPAEINWVGKKI